MKYLKFLMICLSIATMASCQSSNNGSSETNEDKKVKTINHFILDNGEKVKISAEFFDINGKKEKEVFYVNDEELITTFKYNEDNDLIEKIEYKSDGTADDMKKYQYEYDDDKLMKKITFDSFNDDGVYMKYQEETYQYNDKGQLINELSTAIFGNFEYEYFYHPNGKIQKKITYAYEGTEKIFTDYNENGERIKEEVFRRKDVNLDFKSDFINTWVYNEDGTISRTTLRNGTEKTKVIQSDDSKPKPEYIYY